MTVDVSRLPRRTLRAGTKLYRVHRSPPWYFDSSVSGRFNPTQVPGLGTCYLADKPIGAFIEAFRTIRTLTEADIQARALSTIVLQEDLVVANLAVKRALSAGVTAALTSGAEYEEPQQLASDLQGEVDGIRYRARHDLTQQLISIALFGAEGDRTSDPTAGLPVPETEAIPHAVLEEAERLFGYVILPTP